MKHRFCQQARWPNIASDGSWKWAHVDNGTSPSSFRFNASEGCPAAAHNWAAEKDAWLHTYLARDWSDEYLKVRSIDAAGSTIEYAPASPASPGGRWIAVNFLAELDKESEYYIDRSTGIIHFLPPTSGAGVAGIDGAFVSAAHNVINATGLSHVTFRGLHMAHSRGTALVAVKSESVLVDNCTIGNSGGNATNIHGSRSGVNNSFVSGVGCAGVSVIGGDHVTLEPAHNFVTHSKITGYARWKRTYMPGIFWAGVGNRYAHNKISYGPHNAILGGGNEADCYSGSGSCGGNDCVFEHNNISDVAFECDDTGAFYSCGQDGTAFITRGNIVRNNTFTRVCMTEKTSLGFPSVQAVYLGERTTLQHPFCGLTCRRPQTT